MIKAKYYNLHPRYADHTTQDVHREAPASFNTQGNFKGGVVI